MAINLRHISAELHQKLNVRAATEKVTLESLCVRFLWAGLDRLGDLNGKEETSSKEKETEVRSKQSGTRSEPKGSGKHVKAVSVTHGPNGTCGIYRCYTCADLGKKF
jgi:hypothetical protein